MYLPVIVLCLVAIHHAYRVRELGLPRWKGGGFGMFSAVDSGKTRFIRVSLITDGGEVFPVQIPSGYDRESSQLRYVPSEANAQDLAQKLCKRDWVRVADATVEDGDDAPAARLVGQGRIRVLYPQEKLREGAERLDVRALRVEVCTLDYRRSSGQVVSRLLRLVEMPRNR